MVYIKIMTELYAQTLRKSINCLMHGKSHLSFFAQFFAVARTFFLRQLLVWFFLVSNKVSMSLLNQYPFTRLSHCNSFLVIEVPLPLRDANSILKVCKIYLTLLQRQVSFKFCLIYVVTINSGENLTWPTLGKQTSLKPSRLESASLLEFNSKGKQGFYLLTRIGYSK